MPRKLPVCAQSAQKLQVITPMHLEAQKQTTPSSTGPIVQFKSHGAPIDQIRVFRLKDPDSSSAEARERICESYNMISFLRIKTESMRF